MAFPAASAQGVPPKAGHAPERPEEPAAAPRGNTDLDAQIAHLRAIRERLSRTTSPDERQALMAERVRVMQGAMATMHATAGMPGSGGMAQPASDRMAGSRAQGCGSHMALMQRK